MRLFLNALGINNSCGGNANEVYDAIFVNSMQNASEQPLTSGRKTMIHKVTQPLPMIPPRLERFASRNNRLLLQAVEQLDTQIKELESKYDRTKLGIVIGTSTSGVKETEDAFASAKDGKLPPQFRYERQEISSPSSFLAELLNWQGPHYTISTACTSSAKALIEASRLIKSNFCEAVLVGGADTLSSLTLDGFDSLDSLSDEMINPFSRNRRGINIGEGAAMFILSKEPSAVELAGYGESSDAYHISSPDPQGVGAELAIRAALRSACIEAQNVGYINLHGTGTIKNDLMESHVTQRIFGSGVLAGSTKCFIGHTLGAAGAQEAAMCYLALSQLNSDGSLSARLPVHIWDREPDPELASLNLVQQNATLQQNFCVSNSFAFGGNNVSLVFRRSAK